MVNKKLKLIKFTLKEGKLTIDILNQQIFERINNSYVSCILENILEFISL